MLVISGKANENDTERFNYLKSKGFEVWACGTDKRDGADRYFEFHNLPCKENRIIIRGVRSEVEELSKIIPVNNTVSIMLAEAYFCGEKEIYLDGCPMDADEEMKEQKPALAMLVGYLIGKGVYIFWLNGPEKEYYLNKINGVENG